jgi:hypothetical protein
MVCEKKWNLESQFRVHHQSVSLSIYLSQIDTDSPICTQANVYFTCDQIGGGGEFCEGSGHTHKCIHHVQSPPCKGFEHNEFHFFEWPYSSPGMQTK